MRSRQTGCHYAAESLFRANGRSECYNPGDVKIPDSFAVLRFAAFSAVAFVICGFDKWRASGSGGRVPESLRVMPGALGGWPGGLLGMTVFRHKTARRMFKCKYALALIPFAAEVWAWLNWR